MRVTNPLGHYRSYLTIFKIDFHLPHPCFGNCKVLFLQSWRATTTLSQGLPRSAEKEELCLGKSITAKDIMNLTPANRTWYISC